MKFKKKVRFDGVKGYDVVVDGETVGFVYKVTHFDLTEYWSHDKGDQLFITRKEASEDLMSSL